jgi:hypothetical protein
MDWTGIQIISPSMAIKRMGIGGMEPVKLQLSSPRNLDLGYLSPNWRSSPPKLLEASYLILCTSAILRRQDPYQIRKMFLF